MKTIILHKDGAHKERDYTRTYFTKIFDDLNIRDLRPIFSPLQVSTILPRDNAVIVNMGFLKCIITTDTAYFIIHRHQKRVEEIIEEIIKKSTSSEHASFLTLTLEHILDAKRLQIHQKVTAIEKRTNVILAKIRKKFSESDLENLLTTKKQISKLATRNKEILSAAEELLEDEEDIDKLTTLSATGMEMEMETENELESILENFIEQIEDTAGHIYRMGEDIEDTEAFVTLKLNARRTSIIRADLFATLITLILSFLAVIVGLYGVNIRNGLEESPTAFHGLITFLIIFFIIGGMTTYIYLKKKRLF